LPNPDHSRRRFGAAAAALVAAASFPALAKAPPARPLLKPPRLKAGDWVALVAPGGALEDHHVEKSVRNLESLGLKVKLGGNARLRRGNFGGTPYQQAADLHAMFLDREVKAIWAGRGGSGGAQVLPLVDWRIVRANPKIVCGYSDVTALHLAMQRHAGLVSFHAPQAISTWSDYSREHLVAAIMEPRPGRVIRSAAENLAKADSQPEFRERVIREGVAEGPLTGGNLSVISALAGTPYAARMKGAVAFLEDIGEAPYRINRMLMHLTLAGELPSAAGLMLGVFVKCNPPDDEPSLTLEETLVDRGYPLGIPVAMGLSFGHIAHQFTLPMGVRARFDAGERTLALLEAAVL
jgi:muramoyltetrapeptide carboxypeptidase